MSFDKVIAAFKEVATEKDDWSRIWSICQNHIISVDEVDYKASWRAWARDIATIDGIAGSTYLDYYCSFVFDERTEVLVNKLRARGISVKSWKF